MKKQYSKPGIIIENFKISEQIATCQGVQHNNSWGSPQQWSKTTCAWLDNRGFYIFIEGMKDCTKPVDPEGEFFGICYNNPSGKYIIFGS